MVIALQAQRKYKNQTGLDERGEEVRTKLETWCNVKLKASHFSASSAFKQVPKTNSFESWSILTLISNVEEYICKEYFGNTYGRTNYPVREDS